MIELILTYGTLALFLCALIGAAISDIRSYQIPDRFSILIILCFGLFALNAFVMNEASWAFVGSALAAAGISFVIFATLFAFGALGGGDVKLITATSLWAGMTHLVPFLLLTLMAGGLLALIVLAKARFKLAHARDGQSEQTSIMMTRIPYGIAIALGSVPVVLHYWQSI